MYDYINLISALAGLLVAAGSLYLFAFRRGRKIGRDENTAAAVERDQIKEELRRTKLRISDAISGDVFARAVGPGEEALLRRPDRPKVLSVINYKGGVGKTTLSLNLGAYFADSAYGDARKVLLIDLDYQASLSTPLANSIGEEPSNSVWNLFKDDWLPEHVAAAMRRFHFTDQRFPNLSFLSAGFELQQNEERLKFEWALRQSGGDLRFRLASFLQDEAAREFDLVIIDCPPRQTMMTVNALAASTHFLAPTKLDKMAVSGVAPLFRTVSELRSKVWPSLQPLGVVGTFTHQQEPNSKELEALSLAAANASAAWGGRVYEFQATIPTRVNIARVPDQPLAYLVETSQGTATSTHEMFRRLGAEVERELRL